MNMLKTRMGILQDFQKKIEALRALAEKEEVRSANAQKIIETKKEEVNAATHEAKACRSIADKIEDLINAK